MSNKVTNEWVINELLNPTPIPTSILNPGLANKENVPTKSTTTIKGTNILYLALPDQQPRFVDAGGVTAPTIIPVRKAAPISKTVPLLGRNSQQPNIAPQPIEQPTEEEEEEEEEEGEFIPFNVAEYVHQRMAEMQ